MELFLKIAATSLLLLVLSHQPVDLQDIAGTTDTPRRSISPSWLRGKRPLRPLNIVLREVEGTPSADQGTEESGVGSGMDSRGGEPSGVISITMEDSTNGTAEYTTKPSIIPNRATLAPEVRDNGEATTTQIPNVHEDDSGDNATVRENSEETLENSVNASNVGEDETTTLAPEKNVTEATGSGSGERVPDDTETDTNTTAEVPAPDATTQKASEEAGTTASSANNSPEATTALNDTNAAEANNPPEVTASPKDTNPTEDNITPEVTASPKDTNPTENNITPEVTTKPAVATSTPTIDGGNLSDKGADPSDDTAERGFTSESERRQRKSAWGAVLGTFVAVAVVGLVAYVILKKKHHKAFSHRKLEEDFPSDPVLRLDNSEPLDLNFGRAAYYNPGLQGDNIQMSPFPRT